MGSRNMVDEDLITRREAAEMAGVHLNTVRLWESTGRIDTVKQDNGIVMIPRAQVLEIIESRRDARTSDGERAAALEAETRELRRELNELQARYDKLLEEILEITRGRRT